MFNIHHRLCLKAPIFSQTLKPFTLFHTHYPLPFSLPFSTNTSHSHSFTVSYLITNFGFSPKTASRLCSTYNLKFNTPENSDSVLSFFRTHGFSDTQFQNIIRKTPWLLSCDPSKRVLPKFQFFLSKGLSTSHIVNLITKNPNILSPSLENQIVPTYDLVYKFMKSDKDTIAVLNYNPYLFNNSYLARNIRMLIENGVTESNIARMLRTWSWIFNSCENDLLKAVEELKDMGFHPSKAFFAIALMAKVSVSTTLWNEKCAVFKKWGWSDQDIMDAFRRDPHCMLASIDKINLVMSFWVNQLGWDSLELAKVPRVINLSMEGRIIPRAAVVEYLLKKGLRKKNASFTSPFIISHDLFLDRFIQRYEDESSYLLELYHEKLNFGYNRNKTGMP